MANIDFEDILPWGTTGGDTGLSARLKLKRNFDKIKQWLATGLMEYAKKSEVLTLEKAAEEFLSKKNDDAAAGKITFNDTITTNKELQAKKGVKIGNFQSRFLGSGAIVDEHGNAEVESLYSRSFISTPEFRFNRVNVTEGEQWCTNGYGTIKEVTVDTNITGYITLQLEENDYASIAVGDLCRGIYNDIAQQYTTADLDDDSQLYEGENEPEDGFGFSAKQGFFTSYFFVKQIITNRKGECVFLYELRNSSTPHPCAFMKFAQYGSFTNPDRRSSSYATSIGHYYEMVLDGVSTWKIQSENVVYRKGYLGDMTITEKDGTSRQLNGYGLYVQDNVYFGNAVIQLDPVTLQQLREELNAYVVEFSEHVDVITVDDVGNVIGGLYTVSGANNEYRQYLISSAITVRKGDSPLILAAANADAGAGTYKIYTEPHGCSCVVEDSTICITHIDNVKDGIAGTPDDVNFDYNAMRDMTECRVDLIIDCEGRGSIQKKFPIRIKHDAQPFVGADLNNPFSGVSWNTRTQSYVGLPITLDATMWHNNEYLDVSDISLTASGIQLVLQSAAQSGDAATKVIYTKELATITKHAGTAHEVTCKVGRISIVSLPPSFPLVKELNVACSAVYAGQPYERTLTHTINKGTDTNVYSVIPSVGEVISSNGSLSTNSLTFAIVCDSSNQEHYNVTVDNNGKNTTHGIYLCWKKEYADGTQDANFTPYSGAVAIDASVSKVIYTLYGLNANGTPNTAVVHDADDVPVIAAGVDGKGVEFVFIRTKKNVAPTLDSTQTGFDADDFCPQASVSNDYVKGQEAGNTLTTATCTDDPVGTSETWPYEWVAKRTKAAAVNGVRSWTKYTEMSLWANWSKDGVSQPFYIDSEEAWSDSSTSHPAESSSAWSKTTPTKNGKYLWRRTRKLVLNSAGTGYTPASAQDGGSWSYQLLSGTDGTSVNVKGTVATVAALSNINNPQDGDAYKCEADGHLYMWSTEANNWIDLGQFKGEDGDNVHIAWADDVTITNSVATAATGFTIGVGSNGDGKSWMGVCIDKNAADPTTYTSYTWRYVKGVRGEDAAEREWIYKLTNSSTPPSIPSSQNGDVGTVNGVATNYSNTQDDWVPSGWTDNPQSVEPNNKFEWACYRDKARGATTWGPFAGVQGSPILWSHYGERGTDGDGVEYVFIRTKKNVAPTLDSTQTGFDADDFCPQASVSNDYVKGQEAGNTLTTATCTDDPVGTSETWPYEWVAKRTKTAAVNGVRSWTKYTEMSLWANWSKDGEDGQNGQDGQDGKDGVSVESYIETQEAWSNMESVATAYTEPSPNSGWVGYTPVKPNDYKYLWRRSRKMVLNAAGTAYEAEQSGGTLTNDGRWKYVRLSGTDGTSVNVKGTVATVAALGNISNPQDGDAYKCEADGCLYVWSNEANNWVNLGQFKGEDGVTYYTHIAWTDEVTLASAQQSIPDYQGQVSRPNVASANDVGGTNGHFSIAPQEGYDWMGVLINTSPDDPQSQYRHYYTWKYTKGEPGADGQDGQDGADGADGEDGNGIAGITTTYAISEYGTNYNGVETNPPSDLHPYSSSQWYASSPAATTAKPFLWRREYTLFTDGTSTTKYYCIGKLGQDGIDGPGSEWVYIRTKTDTPPVLRDDDDYPDSNGNDYDDDDYLPKVVGNANIENNNSGDTTNHPYECSDDPKGVSETWPYEWEAKRMKLLNQAGTAREWQKYYGAMGNSHQMALHKRWSKDAATLVFTPAIVTFRADADGNVNSGQSQSSTVLLQLPDGTTATPTLSNGSASTDASCSSNGNVITVAVSESGYEDSDIEGYYSVTGTATVNGITYAAKGSLKITVTRAGRNGTNGTNGTNGQDGSPGATGPSFYPAGEYDDSVAYVVTGDLRPFVLWDGRFYYLKKNSQGNSPSNTTYWGAFSNIKFIMAECLFADFAKFGSAIMSGDYMFSQNGKIGSTVYNDGDEYDNVPAYTYFRGDPDGRFNVGKLNGSTSISASSQYPNVLNTLSLSKGQTLTVVLNVTSQYGTATIGVRTVGGSSFISSQSWSQGTTAEKTITVTASSVMEVEIVLSTSGQGTSVIGSGYYYFSPVFVPNWWVDLKTGKMSAINVDVQGTIRATSFYRNMNFGDNSKVWKHVYSDGSEDITATFYNSGDPAWSQTQPRDVYLVSQTYYGNADTDIFYVNDEDVYIPDPDDWEGKQVEIYNAGASSNGSMTVRSNNATRSALIRWPFMSADTSLSCGDASYVRLVCKSDGSYNYWYVLEYRKYDGTLYLPNV